MPLNRAELIRSAVVAVQHIGVVGAVGRVAAEQAERTPPAQEDRQVDRQAAVRAPVRCRGRIWIHPSNNGPGLLFRRIRGPMVPNKDREA